MTCAWLGGYEKRHMKSAENSNNDKYNDDNDSVYSNE